jgi:type III restriction enzyme
MALSPDFPTSPYAILDPKLRWYPGAETDEAEIGKLIPPLVQKIREGVHTWRLAGYPGISKTSYSLLSHWFLEDHISITPDGEVNFQYYFAQREAVETAIWLFEHEQAKTPASLIGYTSIESISTGMFEENWTRYVFKLATGVGKTKVLSLLIAWSYFHKLYEKGSELSTNFLLIAPNIIVLERLKEDFDSLKIFSEDPIIPENGFNGQNWKNDFNVALHIQDEIGTVSPIGNIFLTNIHRIFEGKQAPANTDQDLTDFFLGHKPVKRTNEIVLDLGEVVRQVNDIVILNDEAHHIHDNELAWFKAIENIDSSMRRRTGGKGISVQLDVTATPRKLNGGIFPQTVVSYPLVEAIRQGVVKNPVLPDEASRAKLVEKPSDKVYEIYSDHIKLGYIEWTKYRDRFAGSGKKPILFVMTTTTTEADEVAEYLERTYSELTDKVLVIHTKANGEISESNAKPAELEFLRKASREIDSNSNPYLAVVSVLMLREGWDVQNVVSMVGLRPYSADSKILPEQTLGRGLRRMFRGDPNIREYVSIVGTPAFLEFVEQIQSEGVELDVTPMGPGTSGLGPLVVEVDRENEKKVITDLDVELPVLSRRIAREEKNLDDIDVKTIPSPKLKLRNFTEREQRQIIFRDIDTNEVVWQTDLDMDVIPTGQAVIGFLSDHILRRLRMVGGRDVLFGKIKEYIKDYLFESRVNLEDQNVLRNLSEPEARKALIDNFTEAVNALTITDRGTSKIVSSIKLSQAKPAVVPNQEYVVSNKTVFNRVIGDSQLELNFAQYLDRAQDVKAFAKNMFNIHFKIEYVNSKGEIANYYPDFFVKTNPKHVYIVETKGIEDPDDGKKWNRLVQWCKDATVLDSQSREFKPLYVTGDNFSEWSGQISQFERFAELLISEKPLTAAL